MRLLLLNPNSSSAVTAAIDKEAQRYAANGANIEVLCVEKGPLVVKTSQDEIQAAYETNIKLEKIGSAYDGVIIGCFSDPALAASREMLRVPVTGFMEASLHFANLYGKRFSILGSEGRDEITLFYHLAAAYGMAGHLASVRYLGCGVEGALSVKPEAVLELVEQCAGQDGSDTVLLACGGFAGQARKLSRLSSCHVIDGVKESIYLLQMMIAYQSDKPLV